MRKLRKDEEVRELFYYGLESLERIYGQTATVTINGAWVTIKFGNWETVTARGYANALSALDDALENMGKS